MSPKKQDDKFAKDRYRKDFNLLSPEKQGKVEGWRIAKEITDRTKRVNRSGMGRGTPAGLLPRPKRAKTQPLDPKTGRRSVDFTGDAAAQAHIKRETTDRAGNKLIPRSAGKPGANRRITGRTKKGKPKYTEDPKLDKAFADARARQDREKDMKYHDPGRLAGLNEPSLDAGEKKRWLAGHDKKLAAGKNRSSAHMKKAEEFRSGKKGAPKGYEWGKYSERGETGMVGQAGTKNSDGTTTRREYALYKKGEVGPPPDDKSAKDRYRWGEVEAPPKPKLPPGFSSSTWSTKDRPPRPVRRSPVEKKPDAEETRRGLQYGDKKSIDKSTTPLSKQDKPVTDVTGLSTVGTASRGRKDPGDLIGKYKEIMQRGRGRPFEPKIPRPDSSKLQSRVKPSYRDALHRGETANPERIGVAKPNQRLQAIPLGGHGEAERQRAAAEKHRQSGAPQGIPLGGWGTGPNQSGRIDPSRARKPISKGGMNKSPYAREQSPIELLKGRLASMTGRPTPSPSTAVGGFAQTLGSPIQKILKNTEQGIQSKLDVKRGKEAHKMKKRNAQEFFANLLKKK